MAQRTVRPRVEAPSARSRARRFPEAGAPPAAVKLRSHLRRWALLVLAVVLAGLAGLAGVGPAWATTVSTSPADVVTAEPEVAVRAGATAPSSTDYTAAYVYGAPAKLSSPNAATSYVRGSPTRPRAVSWETSASVRDRGVAAETADAGGIIYRTGSRTPNALTDSSGVSFRDSVSSSLSAEHPQVFRPGDKVWGVDTSGLPSGSVVRDGVPAGHVSVYATPDEIMGAIVDDPFLGQLGLKPLDEFGSYRLPK